MVAMLFLGFPLVRAGLAACRVLLEAEVWHADCLPRVVLIRLGRLVSRFSAGAPRRSDPRLFSSPAPCGGRLVQLGGQDGLWEQGLSAAALWRYRLPGCLHRGCAGGP